MQSCTSPFPACWNSCECSILGKPQVCVSRCAIGAWQHRRIVWLLASSKLAKVMYTVQAGLWAPAFFYNFYQSLIVEAFNICDAFHLFIIKHQLPGLKFNVAPQSTRCVMVVKPRADSDPEAHVRSSPVERACRATIRVTNTVDASAPMSEVIKSSDSTH